MAIQEIAANVTATQEFAIQLRNASDGPGGTPQVDGRSFATLMNDHSQLETGTITITTAGAADGVEVTLGFNPRAIIAYNLSGTIVYFKTASMATAAAAWPSWAAARSPCAYTTL